MMDFHAMYKAYARCRRRKRSTPQAQFYEAYLLDNLVEIVQALQEGSWRPRPPVCFTVARPKAREIHAAHYADRVVHHWLTPRLETLYEPVFIHDVYSKAGFARNPNLMHKRVGARPASDKRYCAGNAQSPAGAGSYSRG